MCIGRTRSARERERERAEMQPRCSRGTAEIEPLLLEHLELLESRTGDIADGHLNAPPGLALLFALFFFGVLPTAISPYLPISPHISPYLPISHHRRRAPHRPPPRRLQALRP